MLSAPGSDIPDMTSLAAPTADFDYSTRVFGDQDVVDIDQRRWGAVRMRRCLASLEGVSGRVLEVGCGAGRCIRTIAHHRPDLAAHGCDLSESAINRAREHRDGVNYRAADAANLPYEDESFDVVVVMDLLEHVPDVGAVLAEIRRTLKPAGRLHLHVPCERSTLSLYRPLLALGFDLTRAAVGHLHHFSRGDVLRALAGSGFVVRRCRYSMFLFGQMHDLITWWSMLKGDSTDRPTAHDARGARDVDSAAPSPRRRFRWRHLLSRPAWWTARTLLPRLQYVEVALAGWQPLGAVGLCVTAERRK